MAKRCAAIARSWNERRRSSQTRFSEGLTVKAIADELYVSRSRLYDAFKNVRGAGVAETLRAERMKAACVLLRSGETSMASPWRMR